MSLTDLLAVVVTGWGIVMAVSPLLQIRRMRLERSSRDVSLGYLVIIIIGFCLWLVYGIDRHLTPLIVTNTISILTSTVTVTVALRLRRQRSTIGLKDAADTRDAMRSRPDQSP